jgi:PAS domain S-box-containing protein
LGLILLVGSSGVVTQEPDKPNTSTKAENAQVECKKLEIAASILESIDDYVYAFDRNWNIIYINDTTSKYFGFKASELIGKNFWATFPKFSGTIIEKNYREAMTKREIRRFEWETIYAHTGAREFTVFPSAEGITVYGVDVTERKRLQQKLEEYAKNLEKLVEERTKQLQEKERLATIGQTAGMVGHDIRNPLQAIAGDLYLVENDVASLPEDETKSSLQESVKSIQGNLLYIAKIVDDLQNFAKIQTPIFQRAKIEDVIEEVMLLVPIPSSLQVSIDIEHGFPEFTVDPSMLKRALTNLVHNAVQAMPSGGKLTVSACQMGNRVNISVEDTGVGIPDEVKPKLFQPMVTTKAKGQGLGLAVAQRLVEAQGGTISFESQVGKGTTFTLSLPKT